MVKNELLETNKSLFSELFSAVRIA